MDLGEEITFKAIVGRKLDGTKSIPISEPIAPLTGTLIGKTRVYTIDNWRNPPTLSDPQTVWVVATSLTKRHKVFMEDIILARTQSDPNDIAIWTEQVLNAKTQAGEEFTAYDITRAVRAAHPGEDIPHDPVRDFVHIWMAGAINIIGLNYTENQKDFGGNTAIVYVPA